MGMLLNLAHLHTDVAMQVFGLNTARDRFIKQQAEFPLVIAPKSPQYSLQAHNYRH